MKNNKFLLVSLTALLAVALPASEMDRRIETAAKASYNYQTVLEDHVKVSSSDGVVTLTGVVNHKDLKSLAEDTVNNLPGVMRVDNQVTVDPSVKEYSDSWMAFKIRSTLLTRSNVSASNTQVSVTDGVVTLTGKAINAAQKDLTEAYAREIDHVVSVKNLLTIMPETAEKTMSASIDDASITSQIKYALLDHRSTSALKTRVSTNSGNVIIGGDAVSPEEKALVTKLAEGVIGVRSVTNNMVVGH